MYDEEIEISNGKVYDILSGKDKLTDKYDIETVLIAIKDMSKKVEFLKELKRRRVSSIDSQIASEEENMDKLETAIKECMADNKDKMLDFPDVAKVQLRNVKGTWNIIDEEGLKTHLQKLNKFSEVSEESWKFKKKELNKLLDELKQNNNTSNCVEKEDDKQSLSITYSKTAYMHQQTLPQKEPVDYNKETKNIANEQRRSNDIEI